jgi:Lon protease-like protein
LLHLFEYLKQSTEEVVNMHNDEEIQLIHRRVEYLKRDLKLEAGYMTMEEYIHSEAERRAKEMAETLAKPMAESMAKPMAESMAESLAASKIAQNIVALLAELGSVPEELRECIAAEKREDTLAAWLKLAVRADSIEELQSKM